MAGIPLTYSIGLIFLFFFTFACATSEEENVYFEYDRVPTNMEDASNSRTSEVSQVKRAVAILNRLVMVAQRANKSQRPHKNENYYGQLHKLSPLNSAGRNDESFSDSVENIYDGITQTSEQKSLTLPRMNFERRDQQTPRVFWRCYFNAVSCFR